MDEVNDRARCGHPQALAHDRRGRRRRRASCSASRRSRSAPRASPRCCVWARGLGGERVWAIEDCRHVSGSFERFLIGRGERVLRVTTQADGRRRGAALAGAGSPTASTRSRSPARRCAKAWTRCRPRSWTAPSSTCGCWSITASGCPPARRAQQHAAVASARPLARARAARQLAVLRQLGAARRAAARARRADDARPHRPRRAAPHPRAHPDHQGARARDRRARRRRSRRSCSPSPASGR